MLQENRSFDSYFSKLGDYATANGIANYRSMPVTIRTSFCRLRGGTGHLFTSLTVRRTIYRPRGMKAFAIDQRPTHFQDGPLRLTSHSARLSHRYQGPARTWTIRPD